MYSRKAANTSRRRAETIVGNKASRDAGRQKPYAQTHVRLLIPIQIYPAQLRQQMKNNGLTNEMYDKGNYYEMTVL